jgi:hypothetical protein
MRVVRAVNRSRSGCVVSGSPAWMRVPVCCAHAAARSLTSAVLPWAGYLETVLVRLDRYAALARERGKRRPVLVELPTPAREDNLHEELTRRHGQRGHLTVYVGRHHQLPPVDVGRPRSSSGRLASRRYHRPPPARAAA